MLNCALPRLNQNLLHMSDDRYNRTNLLKTIPTTVLFADIVDSIDLYSRMGNQEAKELIDQFFNVLTDLVADHHGTVVKIIGDELMCSFYMPLSAIAAARDMQRLAEALNGTRTEQIKLRAGFHAGNVISAAGDLFGDTVNIASRVASVASAGRILTTAPTLALVSAYDAGLVRPWRRELLKGLTEPVELIEVLWSDGGTGANLVNTSLGNYHAPVFHQLILNLQSERRVIDAGHSLLTIGRHAANHLVVHDEGSFVSSHHARIEYRSGVFVITDTSLNGTYISLGGSEFVRIKLPFTLEASCQIIIGYPPAHPNQITGVIEVM